MEKVIIIRYSEIYLKGKNRGFFERVFEDNLRNAIREFDLELVKQFGRYLVQKFAEEDAEQIVEKLKKVFGLHTLSLAYATSSDMDSIFEAAKLLCREEGTFKVESHRGDKKYPLPNIILTRIVRQHVRRKEQLVVLVDQQVNVPVLTRPQRKLVGVSTRQLVFSNV